MVVAVVMEMVVVVGVSSECSTPATLEQKGFVVAQKDTVLLA